MAEQFVKRLGLKKAITEEAATERNMLPHEVDWGNLVKDASRVERSITSQLRSGFNPEPEHITSVRKIRGTRPVAIWGIVERIVYRALVGLALGENFTFDRSGESYLRFVNAPISYASTKQRAIDKKTSTSLFFVNTSEVEYVVAADIAAFYQYIDHNVLARELRLRGGDFDAIDHLIALLQEVQGRTFGIPQLLDSSDFLSEVYIDCVERDLHRHGLAAWRYNDDFRIACRTYGESLQAIEKLDAAARAVGLVTNEYKTLTHGFVKYVWDHVGLVEHERQGVVDLDEIEMAIAEYTEDFSEDLDSARQAVQQAASDHPDESIDPRNISAAGMRRLRRAIGSLAAESDSTVVGEVGDLLPYVPAITPTVCRYLVAAFPGAPTEVTEVVGAAINLSMNEWQAQWLVQLIHELELLNGLPSDGLAERVVWVRNLRLESPSPVTVAYATRALSGSGHMSTDEIVQSLDSSPGVLLPWYAESLRAHFNRTQDEDAKKRLQAVKDGSPLLSSLIGQI
ncbi:RNA-directed DNA polymerase [Amycolatopsis pittospori]|uniref:RNA-directed DNA polymerase n=1 Tax=Amycolatopsis pittospori TaxID=2749434 RepID=UPI0015F1139A|nr:RNA-directed DNA polymerase [Amycolatopsis pittospori]